MKKLLKAMTSMVVSFPLLMLAASAFALDVPTIAAMAKGPNQIILTWSAVAKPGWGYRVEIQSGQDTRYPSWTELSWQNGLSYLPYWVTDQGGTQKVYTDPTTASSGWGENAQCNIYGLKYGTAYNFRVRSYGKTDAGIAAFGSYSSMASATTTTPSTIRYVSVGGAGAKNGTSWANAWAKISNANGVAAGTLVLIAGGNYASDYIAPANSGTAGPGRIVFQANYGETVMIASKGGSYGGPIQLDENFIVLDGISVSSGATSGSEPPVQITGSRNVLANCDFQGSMTSHQFAIVWMNPSPKYNLIHNCYIHENGADQSQGSCVGMLGTSCDNNTVQFSHLSKGAHDQGISKNGVDYSRWLNNLFDGGYGLAWECVSDSGAASTYNLFEGNIIRDTATASGYSAYKPGIELSGNYNTVRRNIVYDGKSTGSLGKNSTGIELSNLGGFESRNNLVYNNTFAHNGNAGFTLWGATDNVIKNNINYNNGIGVTESCRDLHILTDTAAGNGNQISKNLILNVTSAGVEDPGRMIISRAYGNCVTVSFGNANYTDIRGNYDNYSPDFINYSGRDFHLKSTSALIDIGDVVTDPTWGTISYSGNAPDIGAFESFLGPDQRPNMPANLRVLKIK